MDLMMIAMAQLMMGSSVIAATAMCAIVALTKAPASQAPRPAQMGDGDPAMALSKARMKSATHLTMIAMVLSMMALLISSMEAKKDPAKHRSAPASMAR